MYANYWGLSRPPFQNTLDDAWFFESTVHEEALSRLLFVVEERRPCGVVCGAPGTGKSLLLKRLARGLRRSHRHVAEVDLAGVDGHEFLWRLCAELGLAPARGDGPARLSRTLEDHLAGSQLSRRQTVLLLDHVDQSFPECGPVVERLQQLAQRPPGAVTLLAAVRGRGRSSWCDEAFRYADLRIELGPLDARQTARFVSESLHSAGCDRELFQPSALAAVYEESRGVPRSVNRLCELSLLAAMGANRPRIDLDVVRAVAAELAPRG